MQSGQKTPSRCRHGDDKVKPAERHPRGAGVAEIGVARSRAPRKASRRNTGLAESTPSAEFEIFALVDSTSGHPRQDGPGEQSSGIMGCQGASSGKIKANFAT